MKTSLKLAALALVVASFAACKGNGAASTDSTTVKTDSTVKTVDTAAKADTTVKKDTVVKK